MPTLNRSSIVPYSAEEMFALVADIDAYQSFLPWCGGSKVIEADDDKVVAEVMIDFKGVKKSFTTENNNIQGRQISMTLRKGPFRRLDGTWQFRELSAGTRVSLELTFEFAGDLIGRMLGPIFGTIAGTMVDSFVKRAEEVYGKRQFNFD